MRKSVSYLLIVSAMLVTLVATGCGGRVDQPPGLTVVVPPGGTTHTGGSTSTCAQSCSSSEECFEGKCILKAVECDPVTKPCAVNGYICNGSTHKCELVTTCASHDECKDSQICRKGKCIDGTRCDTSAKCQKTEVCRGGACLDVTGKIDICDQIKCGTGLKCENNACVPDCDSPCGGVCCTGSQVCFNDACVNPCPAGNEMCGKAGAAPSCCSSDQACIAGSCTQKGDTCDNATSFCTTVRYCDAKYASCIKYTDNSDMCMLPTVNQFNAVVKLHYTSPKNEPSYYQSVRIPLVADVTGPSGVPDGKPDIIVNTYQSYGGNGILRVISGTTSDPNDPESVVEYWDTTDASMGAGNGFFIESEATPAVGDLDGDHKPDIVFLDSSHRLRAVRGGDGAPLWRNATDRPGGWWNAAAIADLDHDGTPEVIFGDLVLDGKNGTLLCRLSVASSTPTAADLDETGNMEIVSGKITYSFVRTGATAECKPRPIDPTNPSSLPTTPGGTSDASAVAELDERYPGPEIINISGGYLYLLTSRGAEIWNFKLPGSSAGPPTVADFDGDERLEIATADRTGYTITKPWDASKGKYRPHQLWLKATDDSSSGVTGSSIFDFDGDGRAEAVYFDQDYLRIYDGKTGSEKLKIKNTSITDIEYPVIADVDLDGHADIVIVSNSYGEDSKGLRVITDKNNKWVPTRSIWNQHTYHYTNVEDDGTIPRNEKPHWKEAWSNTFRQNMQKGNSRLAPNVVVKLKSLYNDACDATSSSRKISYVIKNLGDADVPANTITTAVSVSRAGANAYAEIDSRKNKTKLGPGDSEEVSFEWDAGTAGLGGEALDIKVKTDTQNSVIECKDDDNEDIKTNVTLAAPNLLPVVPLPNANILCSYGATSNEIEVTFELHNKGAASVPANTAEVKVELSAQISGTPVVYSKTVKNSKVLDAQGFELLHLTFPLKDSEKGTPFDVTITVDPANKIAECVEDDNEYKQSAAAACYNFG